MEERSELIKPRERRCKEEEALSDEEQVEEPHNPNSVEFEDEELLRVENLVEAYGLYGYEPEDYIDLREKVIITTKINKRLTDAKVKFLENKSYEKAAKVRDRLSRLQAEFQEIQVKDEKLLQLREVANLDKAQKCIVDRSTSARLRLLKTIDREAQKRREELAHSHALEQQRLEEYIANRHMPRVRYSKKLLELLHSERHLAKLDKFEEASSLRKRIAESLPLETARHHKSIQHKQDVLRTNLYTRQEFERTKLEEKLITKKLGLIRKFDQGARTQLTMINNQRKEMSHRHLLQVVKPVQFCAVRNGKVRPVIAKRKNYLQTDAAFRGTQMLRLIKADAVENVTSVCDLTDFDKLPEGTKLYDGPTLL